MKCLHISDLCMVSLCLLYMITVDAVKQDVNTTDSDAKVNGLLEQENQVPAGPQEAEEEHIRRKRGSLDPIIGLKPRRILHLKEIRDFITTMDNSRGFRTTFWPLRHRPPPTKSVPFWCLVWIFCWPLLCIYCLAACGLTACFGRFFRKANCLLDSLGFLRTCCLMNFCFCCANRVASKLFSKHVNVEDEPCCKPVTTANTQYRRDGGDSRLTCRPEVYDMQTESLETPFSRSADKYGNFSNKQSSRFSTRQPPESSSSKSTHTTQQSTYSPPFISNERLRSSAPSTPFDFPSSCETKL